MKKKILILGIVIIVMMCCLGILLLVGNEKSYDIRITIPDGSTEDFIYSDEEISPIGKKIKISSGKGLGDTEVVLKTIEVKEENIYEPTYLTSGMPVEMEVEKNAWFKIGVNVQNPTDEDIDIYVTVTGVVLRIK